MPFYKSNSAVIVNDEASATELHQELQRMANAVGKPKFIVLDTLARTMIGDENSSERVGEYIKALDDVKAEYGCTILCASHRLLNKDRARGWALRMAHSMLNLRSPKRGFKNTY